MNFQRPMKDEASPYLDSAEGVMISRDRALYELKRHGLEDPEDHEIFFADLGTADQYDAGEVLRWLGY
ncbi:hypothetical protein SDC9_38242 [bioreactor metagenome]|uniref:Uncharacterized protein n=1 Tax=bioreactor metagenome TaxID=1076179 RepID=A0A644VLI3_9ZZZZ